MTGHADNQGKRARKTRHPPKQLPPGRLHRVEGAPLTSVDVRLDGQLPNLVGKLLRDAAAAE